MKIKMTPVSDILPYVRNPRKNLAAIAGVAASIKAFGFKQPIVIDAEGVIVAGHTRLAAAQSLGLKEVPCVVADELTPQQVKAYRLLDNKLSEKSEWDLELLPLELGELGDFDFEPFEVDFVQSATIDSIPLENKNIDEDEMRNTKHVCPSCGFEW